MSAYTNLRALYNSIPEEKKIKKVLKSITKRYNRWYWSERCVRKYPWSKNPKYFIIRRYAQSMGIGSYIVSTLSQMNYAVKKGYIPVVDMLNYNFTVDNEGNHVNTWDMYFKQPDGILEKAYAQPCYVYSSGGSKEFMPTGEAAFLYDETQIKYWHDLFDRYAPFNDKLSGYMENEYNKVLKGKGKVLGVLCRGTDYIRLRPKGHAIQPEISQVIEKVHEIIDKYNCDYIYLATEDKSFNDAIEREFPNKVLTNKRIYKEYYDGYLAETYNEREADSYLTNIEYLSSLYLLSKCNCLLCGRTSGTVIAMLMNSTHEYKYFWDIGEY